MWSAPEEKQLFTICSGIEIAEELDDCVTSASVSSAAHPKCSFIHWVGTGLHVKLYRFYQTFASIKLYADTYRGNMD